MGEQEQQFQFEDQEKRARNLQQSVDPEEMTLDASLTKDLIEVFSRENEDILQRAWHRIVQMQEPQQQDVPYQQPSSPLTSLTGTERKITPMKTIRNTSDEPTTYNLYESDRPVIPAAPKLLSRPGFLGILAATIVAAILVSSMVTFLALTHTQPGAKSLPNTASVKTTTSQAPVYIDNGSGVYKLDPQTGKESWHFAPSLSNGGMVTPPTISGETVYIQTRRDYVYAINSTSGQEKWIIRLSPQSGFMYGNIAPLIVRGNLLYASDEENVYVLDTTTGAIKNTYNVTSSPQGCFNIGLVTPFQVSDTTLYVACSNVLTAYNLSNQTQPWQLTTQSLTGNPNVDNFSGITLVDSTLYTSVFNTPAQTGQIIALDATSGHQLWLTSPMKGLVSPPVISNGTVYASAYDDNPSPNQTTVSAYDATNGKTIWSEQLAGTNSIEVWVVDKVVLLNMTAATDASGRPPARTLLALSTSTGKQLWTQSNIEVLFIQDHVIYAANDPNYMAINPTNGQVIWQKQYP